MPPFVLNDSKYNLNKELKIFSVFASIPCRASKHAVCTSTANNFEHFVRTGNKVNPIYLQSDQRIHTARYGIEVSSTNILRAHQQSCATISWHL
jgi:hypothetical protein